MKTQPHPSDPGPIILFGSGEMSSIGRTIQEQILLEKKYSKPVTFGILETPSGFEVNAKHGWPERMEKFFLSSLANFDPHIVRIHALRRDGGESTNSAAIVDPLLDCHYIYCGAGSPTYAVTHLSQSRAYDCMIEARKQGSTLCFGSATAIAMSSFTLPVYEIFKAGSDVHWVKGLDFFAQFGISLVIVSHWNNHEGKNFDTTRCYMGVKRFEKLCALLPKGEIILGIDELTAVVVYPEKKKIIVVGKGSAYVLRNKFLVRYSHGKSIPWESLVSQ